MRTVRILKFSFVFFLLHTISAEAQYPNSGYVPLVPNTIGASVSPVVPVQPLFPARNVPVPTPPPPTPPPPSTQFVETVKSSSFTTTLLPIPEKSLNILDFWFSYLPTSIDLPNQDMLVWFSNSPEIDRLIREYFAQDVLNAMRGEYNSWRATPRGRLALILLLDQFTRRIYRNTPQAFTADRMARALVLEGLQKGDDKALEPIERAFFYLPLEQAEDLQLQNLAVGYYQQLLAESPTVIKPQIQAFLQNALFHRQQIARFGRFPRRNAILGRESSPEEIVFLNQWGRGNF